MKKLTLITLLAIASLATYAQTLKADIDSTLALLKTQDVDERMATYYSFADRNRFSDYDSTMTVLLQYEKDAELNHRTHDADLARRMQYLLTDNSGQADKAMTMLDVFIEKCDREKSHDIYVGFVNDKIDGYVVSGKTQTALVETKKIFSQTPDSDKAMLAMLYLRMGDIYQTVCNDSMSLLYLNKSLELCHQVKDYNMTCNVYFGLCNMCIQAESQGTEAENYHEEHAENFKAILRHTDDWWQVIDKAEKEDYPNFNARLRRVLCLYMKAVTYNMMGEPEKLHSAFEQMAQLTNDGEDMYMNYIEIKVFDLVTSQKYEEALAIVDEVLEYHRQNSLSTNTVWLKVKAKILHKLGRHDETYSTLIENNQIDSDILCKISIDQLNEFSTIYEVQQVKNYAAQLRSRLLIAVVTAVLLLALAAVIVFYNRRLKQHIRMLCERIDSMSKPQADVKPVVSNKPSSGTTPTARTELFSEVERVLSDSEVLTSGIDRDELAKMVGTNRTYLADCIHESTGLSLSDYINTKRLSKAIDMLKENAEMKITEISEAVGFASYTTFYRIFSKQYGVSPVDYRNYLLEKHESATA